MVDQSRGKDTGEEPGATRPEHPAPSALSGQETDYSMVEAWVETATSARVKGQNRMQERQPDQSPSISRVLSNPWVGFIGMLASVIGVVSAVYFYLQTKEVPQLTYSINPAKTTIVKTGQASRLTVLFDNARIESDITAIQLAIWNAGKRSIKAEHMLDPIMITTSDRTPILEASLRKVTRQVVSIALDMTRLHEGMIPISWRILEHNDGAVIQVIFAGGSNVAVTLMGAIEGQKDIAPINVSASSILAAHPLGFLGERYAGWVGLVFSLVLFLSLPWYRLYGARFAAQRLPLWGKRMFTFLLSPWTIGLMGLVYLCSSLYLLLFWAPVKPPLGF